MYPGIACNRDIPAKKTKAFPFKRNENDSTCLANILPGVNVSETNAKYLITLAAPGLQRSDFNIEIKNQTIIISANKETNPIICENDRCEYDYSDWTRAFTLPTDADAIFAIAEYINGELVIHIPRSNSCENKTKATIYVY